MNALVRSAALSCVLVFCAGAVAATPSPSPAPVSLEYQIEVLLKRRLKPEPLPLELPNPFVMTVKSRRETTPTRIAEIAPPAVEARPISTTEVLDDCVKRLRFGGIIRMKDQLQIVINDIPRKEGDPINVLWNSTQIQIRLLRLAPDQIVLSYLGSEKVVKL